MKKALVLQKIVYVAHMLQILLGLDLAKDNIAMVVIVGVVTISPILLFGLLVVVVVVSMLIETVHLGHHVGKVVVVESMGAAANHPHMGRSHGRFLSEPHQRWFGQGTIHGGWKNNAVVSGRHESITSTLVQLALGIRQTQPKRNAAASPVAGCAGCTGCTGCANHSGRILGRRFLLGCLFFGQ